MNPCTLISSTIFTPRVNSNSVLKSVYSSNERTEQTRQTITSLKRLGYEDIRLYDNSGTEYQSTLEKEFPEITVKTLTQYQFDNKGISETFMLLSAINDLPDDIPIIKISGRYQLSKKIDFNHMEFQLGAKFYRHNSKLFTTKESMATRCYIFSNKKIFEQYLTNMLEEIYAHSARIIGAGSLKRFLINQFMPNKNVYSYLNPIYSVEAASVPVIKKMGLNVQRIDNIGLFGLAGTFENHLIED
ncbi:MAG: hypothetical protein SFV55_05525 [Haliscomenobacter sp.]|uniref:hypothetical protein n=1 Tax=Haliscomenobacter sp. TaxID=2717303 RepID=UPI0029AD1733|nr:hypothetical protein [Haliscomenobacter sp.]MDX2067863.1 hypothetical protein [Haliscomenobacter sp.]